jgi:hypothetical protein
MTVRQYFFWFLAVPLAGLFVLVGTSPRRFEDMALFQQILLWVLGPPVLINLFLGPSIYSFWKRKKGRALITVINILLVFVGVFPGLLLWIWAWRADEEPLEEQPPTP